MNNNARLVYGSMRDEMICHTLAPEYKSVVLVGLVCVLIDQVLLVMLPSGVDDVSGQMLVLLTFGMVYDEYNTIYNKTDTEKEVLDDSDAGSCSNMRMKSYTNLAERNQKHRVSDHFHHNDVSISHGTSIS
jgi:hypothetical protein